MQESPCLLGFLNERAGDPSRIRTCNPRSRNPLLYPVELWDRRTPHITTIIKKPPPGHAKNELRTPLCSHRNSALSCRGEPDVITPRRTMPCFVSLGRN